MRWIFTAVAVVVLLTPGAASGDLQEDHPEWFGYTAPLDPGVPIRWSPTYARAWMAPDLGDAWHAALLGAMIPEAQLTILARGEQNQLDLYVWMESEDLLPAEHGWIDLEAVDSPYAGEWGPVALRLGDEEGTAMLLDGRYYSLRPSDDAAPGRMAEAAGAPLHRIPLFFSGAQIQGTSDGLCLVGPELFNLNIGHTAEEIHFALRGYAGCERVVEVPAPADMYKKKPMDLYLRLSGAKASAGDGTSWGVLLGDTSSWSLSLQEGLDEIRGVLEAVDGGGLVTVTDVPWPESVDGTVRSYLPFIALDGALVLPVYMGLPTMEEAVTQILLQELGDVEIRTLPSDLAAQLEIWPSRIVGGGAGEPWSDLQSPEILCDSGDPTDCGDCLPECGAVQAICTVGPDGPVVDACVEGPDGCLDRLQELCPEEQICVDGACEDPPATCDTLPAGGICDGSVLVRCVAGQVIEIDCAQELELCGYEESGEAACFKPCEGGCQIPGETSCGETATAVLTCEVGPEGCPEWVEALCPASEICEDGVCVAAAADGPDHDGGVVLDTAGDGPSVNAGYGRHDGCGVGVCSRRGGSALWFLILILGLLVRRYPLYKHHPLP